MLSLWEDSSEATFSFTEFLLFFTVGTCPTTRLFDSIVFYAEEIFPLEMSAVYLFEVEGDIKRPIELPYLLALLLEIDYCD